MASQDFHSTLGIPRWCSLLTWILLHPVSTRSALHSLCWEILLVYPCASRAEGTWPLLLLLPGASAAFPEGPVELLLKVLQSAFLRRFFWMLTCCLCDTNPHKLGKPRGNVHLINSDQLCFYFRSFWHRNMKWRSWECPLASLQRCFFFCPSLFFIAFWFMFKVCSVCTISFVVFLSISLPSSMTERKIVRREGIIVWFKVIWTDFFQQCAEQS